ncbi:SemiSWEET family sugar transporter [Sediminicola arcticus]|jgi:MtN3 and saliva related transmembrane protein|uniref:SemiSWEET transporter n=1 Tax=Sediminicola arcticus TaxID=1574308 RepID=A0ABV2SQ07_9FLAO
MIDKIEIIGLAAAVLTTTSFVPQVYKAWNQKATKDISLTMYLSFFMGVVLWFIYGIQIESLSIILANSVTGLLVFIVIILKLKYK